MHSLKARLAGVLDCFGAQRILVLGDLMLDRYIYGRVRRISQEAPVPVVAVSDEVEMPGGASNVALNLRALGAGAAVAGWVGSDAGGARLEALLAAAGVDISAVARLDGLRTTVKERIVAEHQQVVRVDWDAAPGPDAAAAAAWHAALARVAGTVTGAVIEDFGKG
ncbi:MAG: bifunctional heptose 7-phosphate kinase/heptose 1-phosphate adenyltransferase, partial [Candidatus Marinimicrobia bacterium]|nr:bifunctional heptose 7-phosphate kinase/heptose 1-phosphate adenyltransferase [Candidatus Neomarinimicrobiota bacterium]